MVAISLTMVAAVSGFVGLQVGAEAGERAVPGAWSLLGVRDGGRTLVVRGPEHGSCDRVSVTADESQPGRVVIRSFVHQPRGSAVCILMLHGGERFAVPLERPILGRSVDGPRRIVPSPIGFLRDVDVRYRPKPDRTLVRPLPLHDREPPSVVGLRFRDARHALCNAGYETRRPSGDRMTGMVVAQSRAVVPRMTGRRRAPTCRNGMLPAVDLTVWAR